VPPSQLKLPQQQQQQKPHTRRPTTWVARTARRLRHPRLTSAPVSTMAAAVYMMRLTMTLGIVNSPVSTPAPALDFPDEYELYQQRRADRALEIAAKESGKRQAVNTSYLGTFFGPTSSHVLKDSTATLEKSAATTELTVEEPKTPTKKRVPNHWHGLPSPETPTFHGSTSEKPLAGSKGSQEEGSSVVTPHTPQAITDRDALLAHELEAELSPSTTRRSTRLRAVPKSNCKFLSHTRRANIC
jgi:hypothetical protein